MTQFVRLPQMAWNTPREISLSFPGEWQIEVYNMAGYDRRAMTRVEIKKVLENTIGTAPIKELARGKKEVAIIFDDMSRITNVKQIVPFILKDLEEAGVTEDKIRFFAALGAHGALNRTDFVKKLGDKIVRRFPVYNHNPFGKCEYVGTTQFGTRVLLNAEIMKCDLKIGIGSIVPHPMAGFGGGSKIIIPGIASIETIEAFHRLMRKIAKENPDKPVTGMGVYDNNPQHLNIEEAGTFAGLFVKIDCIVNAWGQTTALYAGVPRLEHAAGASFAKGHYLTQRAENKDIVIANAFAKVNEFEIVLDAARPAVSSKGGDIVICCDVPGGHATHYVLGPFGPDDMMTGHDLRLRAGLPPNINNLIIYSRYPDIASRGYFKEENKVLFMSRWEDVLLHLQNKYPGDAKVAVFPNADIQYFN